jgi:hypothetical protein
MTDRHTERTMLDLLHRRYNARSQGGDKFLRAEHVRNGTGFMGWNEPAQRCIGQLRTADFVAVNTWESQGHMIIGHEVKVSRSDWLHELADPEKAEAWKRYCDRWYLVVSDRTIVRPGELPAGWGLLAPAGDSLRTFVRAGVLERAPMPTPLWVSLGRAIHKTTARTATTHQGETP